MWVEFDFGCFLPPRIVLWVLWLFFPPLKYNTLNSNSTRIKDLHENQLEQLNADVYFHLFKSKSSLKGFC